MAKEFDPQLPLRCCQNLREFSICLRQLFQCSSCSEYTVPPIHMCSLGHNICHNCQSEFNACRVPECLSTAVYGCHNKFAESLSKHILLPCANFPYGCTDHQLLVDLKAHEWRCSFREYTCPLTDIVKECEWKGRYRDIISHVTNQHPDKVKRAAKNVTLFKNFDMNENSDNGVVILVYNEIFVFRFKSEICHGKWFGMVKLIGHQEKSTQFKYELQISVTNQDMDVAGVFRAVTVNERVQLDDAYKEGKCAILELAVLQHFVSINNDLTFTVNIIQN